MTLYSCNLNTPDTLPDKIVLSNGFTRTDVASFTAEEIADAGYVAAPNKPSFNNKTHRCLWEDTEWVVSELNDDEKTYIKNQQWILTIRTISEHLLHAYGIYRSARIDIDAGKEPMFLVADVDAYILKLDHKTIYDAYDETLACFTVPMFNWQKTNPDWNPE